VRLADLRLPLWRVHLEVCPFVEGGKISTFGFISHHDEVIAWDVPASWCLNSDFETRLDDLRCDSTCEIQAFPHCPGGRQQFIDRSKVHGKSFLCIVPRQEQVWQWMLRKGYGSIVHA